MNKFPFQKVLALFTPMFVVVLMGAGCVVSLSSSVSDGGVYRSADAGTTWEQAVFVAQSNKKTITISSLNVSQLVVSPVDTKVILAVVGASGLYGTANSGDSWQQVFRQGTQAVAVHPTERGVWYVASGNQILRTTDTGGSWQELYLEGTPQAIITDVAIDPTRPTTVYGVTSKGVLLVSDDEGVTWQKKYVFPTGVSRVIINPRDTRVLYVAAPVGEVWRSSDRGENWENVTDVLRKQTEVRRSGAYKAFAFLPNRPDAFLLATSYGLFRTYNSGRDWEQIKLVTSSDSVTITTLVVDPSSEQNIFYTADATLYRTKDAGSTWETIRQPSSRSATALTTNPTDGNILYLGFTRAK